MSTDLLMPVMKRGKHTYRQTWILLFLAGLSVLLILFFVNVVNISEENSDMRFGDKIGRNQMSFDLGLEVKDFENVSVLRDFTVKLNEEFDLVMITEQIDESLILLQNLLCWEIDDVVTFKLNARNEKFIKRLTPSVRLRLQKVNYADQVLYNFFKERLAEKIQNFGRAKLGAKVKELRIRKDFWYNFCVHGETLLINTKGIEKLAYVNPKVTKLKVRKNDTCIKMTEYELTFTEMLRLKQKHLVSYYTGNNS
ncbi:galactosylceramide sulfotransferase-like isoform X2 [Tachypleus tridentatus]|uniref:galactosylceramide sulfotransferase-like isoform X2 n=1 Tax=Tachypleus tridentatus TaxID=6853 RepID=UPI003FD03CEF